MKLKNDVVFTTEDAYRVGDMIGIDWTAVDVEQFRRGLEVELEHGTVDPVTNVTNDDEVMTGKIALAHINEIPDYYTHLDAMEEKAERKTKGKK